MLDSKGLDEKVQSEVNEEEIKKIEEQARESFTRCIAYTLFGERCSKQENPKKNAEDFIKSWYIQMHKNTLDSLNRNFEEESKANPAADFMLALCGLTREKLRERYETAFKNVLQELQQVVDSIPEKTK
jgi:hypothetical protein